MTETQVSSQFVYEGVSHDVIDIPQILQTFFRRDGMHTQQRGYAFEGSDLRAKASDPQFQASGIERMCSRTLG